MTLIVSTIDAKILFKQTASTSCSGFQHFDRGKGENVGGETCKQANGGIAVNKPSKSERAEVRGLGDTTIQKGKKYYISWDFMLSSTVTDNALFQWKAYGRPMKQNFPVVIKFIDNVLNVMQFQDRATVKNPNRALFQKKLAVNQWYSHMIAISVSDQNEGGTVEYWFEGVQQELLAHGKTKTIWPCRTFDGTEISPKFGIYGALGTDVTSTFKNILMGETLEDMNYGTNSSLASSSSKSTPTKSIVGTGKLTKSKTKSKTKKPCISTKKASSVTKKPCTLTKKKAIATGKTVTSKKG